MDQERFHCNYVIVGESDVKFSLPPSIPKINDMGFLAAIFLVAIDIGLGVAQPELFSNLYPGFSSFMDGVADKGQIRKSLISTTRDWITLVAAYYLLKRLVMMLTIELPQTFGFFIFGTAVCTSIIFVCKTNGVVAVPITDHILEGVKYMGGVFAVIWTMKSFLDLVTSICSFDGFVFLVNSFLMMFVVHFGRNFFQQWKEGNFDLPIELPSSFPSQLWCRNNETLNVGISDTSYPGPETEVM